MDVNILSFLIKNGIMNKSIFFMCYIFIVLFNLSSCNSEESSTNSKRVYSAQDWKIFNACKAKIYRNENNRYDYLACSEMLKHKKSLRKYGAFNSYNYWINRLYVKRGR